MVVRVRLQPLWKLFLAVGADLLIFLGIAGVVVWLWGLSDGAIYQYVQGVHFGKEAASGGVGITGNSPVPDPLPRPDVPRWLAPALPARDPLLLGRLEIPSIHLSVMVREGVDAASLRKAAGHLPSSALPGDAGNSVLLGHRDTFFRPLRGIAQGDPIHVKTQRGSFQYIVDLVQVVPPEQSLAFPQDMPAKSITLITCFPFDYVGPAPRRFVVRAHLAPGESVRSELAPSVHEADVESPLEKSNESSDGH